MAAGEFLNEVDWKVNIISQQQKILRLFIYLCCVCKQKME